MAAKAVQEILPLVDLLKISEEEEDLLPAALEETASIYNISLVVKTRGSNGAICLLNGKMFYVEGIKTVCVDTTGAGDAFWGGFLSCLIRNNVESVDDLNPVLVEKALRYGNICGAMCVENKGAIESLPYYQETTQRFAEVYSIKNELG